MLILDFQPLKAPPAALPTCTWNGITLWRGDGDTSTLDMSSKAFHEAFRSIYESVGFCDLAHVLSALEEQHSKKPQESLRGIDRSALFAAYNFRYDKKIEKLLAVWADVPQTFKQWAKKHAIAPADVYPLCAVEDVLALSSALAKIADMQCSRSQGAQIIELLTECSLLNIPKETLLGSVEDPQQWVLSIQQLRFPQTLARDKDRQENLLTGWPKAFSTRWLRQGDRSGVEVRFFISSKKDLEEKISTLSRVHEGLE